MWKCMVALLALLLAGCTSPKSYETLADVHLPLQEPQPREMSLQFPEKTAVTSMTDGSSGKLYLCEGYTILVQTMDGGDLDRTLRAVSGFGREHLQIMEREESNHRRIECVWAAAGEGGDQICRAVILDDGNFHYTLTLIADASTAGQFSEQWQKLSMEFTLGTDQ